MSLCCSTQLWEVNYSSPKSANPHLASVSIDIHTIYIHNTLYKWIGLEPMSVYAFLFKCHLTLLVFAQFLKVVFRVSVFRICFFEVVNLGFICGSCNNGS